jgi:Na+-driven multidrug efflux pump
MDMEGAAWAKVIAYSGSVVVLWWYVQRVYPMTYDLRRIVTTLFITGLLYATTIFVPYFIVAVLALPAYVLLLLVTGVIERSTLQTLLRLVRR